MEVWRMNLTRDIERLSDEEVQALPQWVVDTLDNGMLAVYERQMYGLSPSHLLGTENTDE
jgi:hypothetical protein